MKSPLLPQKPLRPNTAGPGVGISLSSQCHWCSSLISSIQGRYTENEAAARQSIAGRSAISDFEHGALIHLHASDFGVE